MPEYVIRRQLTAPLVQAEAVEATPPPDWLGAGLGAAALAFPPLAGIAAVNEQMGGLTWPEIRDVTYGPVADRIREVPHNITKPVTPEEERPISQPGPNMPIPGGRAGSEPGVGLMARRAAGELVGVGAEALMSGYRQTSERALGAARYLNDTNPLIGGQGISPYLNVPSALLEGVDITPEEKKEAFLAGTAYFEANAPIAEQLVLPFVPGADPLMAVSFLLHGSHLSRVASRSYQFSLVEDAAKLDDVRNLIRTGDAFDRGLIGSIVRKIPGLGEMVVRPAETNAALAMQTFLRWSDNILARAASPAEKLELWQGMALRAAGKTDEAERIFNAYNLGRRTVTAEEAAQLSRAGAKAGDVINPFATRAGNISTLVSEKLFATPGAKRNLGKLLEAMEAARLPDAAPETIAAGSTATRNLLARLVDASNEAAGVTRKKGLLKGAYNVARAYQGFYAETAHFTNPGFAIRNGTANFTSGLMDGVLGPYNPKWFTGTWRSGLSLQPEAVTRGVGAGFEARTGISGWLEAKGGIPKRLGQALGFAPKMSGDIENVFASMAVRKGINWVMDNVWRGQYAIPSETLTGLRAMETSGQMTAGMTDKFMDTVESAWHPADVRRLTDLMLGGETWRIPPAGIMRDLRLSGVDEGFQRIVETAPNLDDFNRTAKNLEAQVFEQTAKAGNLGMPGSDEARLAMAEHLASLGMPEAKIPENVNGYFRFTEGPQEATDLAKSYLTQTLNALPEAERSVWRTKLDEFYAKWNAERERVVGVSGGIERGEWAGLLEKEDALGQKTALWKKFFNDRIDEIHDFREEVEKVTGSVIPGDVARAVTDAVSARPVAGFPRTPPEPVVPVRGAAPVVPPVVPQTADRIWEIQAEIQNIGETLNPALRRVRDRFFVKEPGGYRSQFVWLDLDTGNWKPYTSARPGLARWVKKPGAEVAGWGDQAVEMARESGIQVESFDELAQLIDQEQGLRGGEAALRAELARLQRPVESAAAVPQVPAAPRVPVAPAAPTLPPGQAGGKPRYQKFQLAFDSDTDRALYTLANPATSSKREAEYLAWLKTQFPENSEAELRAMGRAIRARIKGLAQAAGAGEEVIRIPGGQTPRVLTGPRDMTFPRIATGGAPPDPAVSARAQLPEAIARLRRAREWVAQNWGIYAQADAESARLLKQASGAAQSRLAEVRALAENVGTAWRDETYFNYSDRDRFAMALGGAYGYPFWFAHQRASFMRRIYTNPHALLVMMNARDRIAALNADLPEWLKTTIQVSLGDAGLLNFPLFANFDPDYSLWAPDFHDPVQSQDPMGRAYHTLNDFGPGATAMIVPQVLGMLAYYADKPELALSYAGNVGLTNKLIAQATGFAPMEQALSIPFPQYSLMFQDGVYVGSKWDQRKIGIGMNQMVKDGLITQELAAEALHVANDPLNPKWAQDPSYARALQTFKDALWEQRKAALPATAMSWLGGPAFRYKSQATVELEASQQAYAQLKQQIEALRAGPGGESALRWPGGAAQPQPQAVPDQIRDLYRAFWADPKNADYSLFLLWNAKGKAGDEAYAWSALGRVGTGRVDNAILRAAGMDGDLMTEFYQNGGIPDRWLKATADYTEFMDAVDRLGAVLALPELGTTDEWYLARDRNKRVVTKALAAEFPPEVLDAYETYMFGGLTDSKGYLESHPEILPLMDRKAELVMSDPLVASYYAADSTVQSYLYSRFNQAHAADKVVFDAYARLMKDASDSGDPIDKAIAEKYRKENKAVIDRFRADRKEFKAGLDAEIEATLARIAKDHPVKLPTLRPDIADLSTFTEAQREAERQQAQAEQERMGAYSAATGLGEAEIPDDADLRAEAYSASNRAVILAEQADKDANTSYLDLDTPAGSAREVIETTWNAAFLSNQAFRDDPRLAKKAFEKVSWVWDNVPRNPNFLAYLGESIDFRQALLLDTSPRWQGVVAALRDLTPDQVNLLADSVPGIRPAWQQAQQWTEGPSEAARADIGGVNVTFNIDGTVSVTRQSVKKAFGGVSGGAGYGDGGVGPAGPDGPRVKRGVWPEGRDPNKYYGGEGPDLPGFPRRDIPYGGQYGPQPRQRRSYRRGRNRGGANRRRKAAAFNEIIGSLSSDLREFVLEYLGSPPERAGQLLAASSELQIWLVGQDLDELQDLFQSWLSLGQAQAEVAPPGSNGGPRFGPVVRVYPRRSETGLF